MKKIVLLLLLISSVAAARSPHNSYKNRHDAKVSVCTLSPFSSIYADVGFSESSARYKVAKRCEKGQGKGSIFCKEADAKCVKSKLNDGDDGFETLVIYSMGGQNGSAIEIDEDVPNLFRSHSTTFLSSFDIPSGWVVRFYEGENYTGKYHTEKAGSRNTVGYSNQTRSIKIIKR